jgi:low-density lipoprotein receptor-related protein 1 (alpha-2-macroglobulin receptor)
VYQLSFDWIGTNYYFVDEALEIIFICKADLSICKTIIDAEISKPRALAVDPTTGYATFYKIFRSIIQILLITMIYFIS